MRKLFKNLNQAARTQVDGNSSCPFPHIVAFIFCRVCDYVVFLCIKAVAFTY